MDLLASYLQNSSTITLVVLLVLFVQFFLVQWTFFYRFFTLLFMIRREKRSLQMMRTRQKRPLPDSFLHSCFLSVRFTKENGDYCIFEATNESTKGLTFLSIAASTSPFIGLFGTVVSILETFYILGKSKATLSTISASIAEALIATAAGILVAIFAYSYHLILKRKAYEFVSYLRMQIDIMLMDSGNV
jgi:hypothetical protein